MKFRTTKFCTALIASAAILAFSGLAQAQDYPTKPVTMITPAAAGNSPDVVSRIVADKLSQMWKQQVVVLNKPGAGGLIAAQTAAASNIEKDGHTLYLAQASTYTVLPIMQEGKMGVDLHKAFVAVGMVGEQPIGVAVNKDVPVNTIPELIAWAKKSKDPVLFAATNRGGQSHLTGELFREKAPANITFVHSAGASASINDVIAGRIPIIFEALAALRPGTESGALRLIGVASIKRLPNRPELPTVAETVPGLASSGWIVLMAPAGVPDAIIRKVNGDLRKVVAMPDVQEKMQTLGTYSRDLTPRQTEDFILGEEKLWWPVVREINKPKAQ